jgi:HNH endonuclease
MVELVIIFGLYIIDEDGIIISLHKRNPGKIISKRIDRAGYYSVRLSNEGKSRTFFLHRLMAVAFIPNPENKPYVNHINGNKLDCSISNLQWCTHEENIQHAYAIGLCNVPACHCKRVVDLDTGEIFRSVMQAAKAKGLAYSSCKNSLRGRRKNRTRLILLENIKGIDN